MQTSFEFAQNPRTLLLNKWRDIAYDDSVDEIRSLITWKDNRNGGIVYRGMLTWLGDDLAQAIIIQRTDHATYDLGWHRFIDICSIKNIKKMDQKWLIRLRSGAIERLRTGNDDVEPRTWNLERKTL
jgi:hypothetical protein